VKCDCGIARKNLPIPKKDVSLFIFVGLLGHIFCAIAATQVQHSRHKVQLAIGKLSWAKEALYILD
jgi:hypothetical protein